MQQPADVVVRPAIKHVPVLHERIVRCGLGIVPISSETEDKFEDAMEVTASSPLPEIAGVLLRFDHIASIIENANHSNHCRGCLAVAYYIARRIPTPHDRRPNPKESELIDTALISARQSGRRH